MTLNDGFLERLAASAAAEGLIDASFSEVPTPLGRLLVVQTSVGVCRIGFPEEDPRSVLAAVAAGVGPRVVRSERETRPAAEALVMYLEGASPQLPVPVDLSLVRSDFQRSVLQQLVKDVGRGSVTTYGALAARIGRPKAVRATGTALGRNPVPIVVPCHRVLPGGGGVGNYGGGADRKRWLLALEGAPSTAR
jgi:methylated-DNA-[protein]-cysteine S-methyltransferase